MVRGCQKKIIYLKNTDSGVFDEAYFLVSDSALGKDMDERDMIEEANRILDECVFPKEKKSPKNIIIGFIKAKVIPVISGIAVGIIIGLFIK
ncbi:MAG: hypothetical protein IJW53_02035 [Clostridia bacterium]|nr:hypothetical protein [Clostridia bacterium]